MSDLTSAVQGIGSGVGQVLQRIALQRAALAQQQQEKDFKLKLFEMQQKALADRENQRYQHNLDVADKNNTAAMKRLNKSEGKADARARTRHNDSASLDEKRRIENAVNLAKTTFDSQIKAYDNEIRLLYNNPDTYHPGAIANLMKLREEKVRERTLFLKNTLGNTYPINISPMPVTDAINQKVGETKNNLNFLSQFALPDFTGGDNFSIPDTTIYKEAVKAVGEKILPNQGKYSSGPVDQKKIEDMLNQISN